MQFGGTFIVAILFRSLECNTASAVHVSQCFFLQDGIHVFTNSATEDSVHYTFACSFQFSFTVEAKTDYYLFCYGERSRDSSSLCM